MTAALETQTHRATFVRPTHIPLLAAARLRGLSERQVWTRVRRGDFPPLVHLVDPATGQHAAHVLLHDFEFTFVPVSDAQLARALVRPPPKARKWPAKFSQTYVDEQLARRDIAWMEWLQEKFDCFGPYPDFVQDHQEKV